MPENPKVLVGCPISSYREDVIDQYIESVKSLTYKNYEVLLIDNSETDAMFNRINGKVPVQKTKRIEKIGEMLARDRNVLRKKALDEGFDYFLSLEQDVMPPKDVIERLLANEKQVCSGMYFNMYATPGPNNEIYDELRPVFSTWVDETQKELRVVRNLGFQGVFPSRLMQICSGGVGCVLISRDVLEKIFFRTEAEFKTWDDVFFYEDCYSKGIEPWLDSSVLCLHRYKPWPTELRAKV